MGGFPAPPIAQPSINTLIQLGNSASPIVYTTVANVGDMTGPTFAAAVVDVTSHSTTVPWREKITTLLDPGQLSFKLYFITDYSPHRQLFAVFANRTLANWRMVFPDQDGTVWFFQAYISKFSVTSTVAGVTEAAVTFELVSQPTLPLL